MSRSPLLTTLLMTTLATSSTSALADGLYAERYRPQFHFTSTTDWINDPNGLVFFDGEYHLYFQRAPAKIQGEFEKSWGRAFSKDLVHWEQTQDDAILPDENGSIWSGSAVVDWNNTSGFGKDGKPPLVAAYTRADNKGTSDQRIAYSTDRGRTWTKYPEPVLPHINGINRDPKLIWHEPTKQWLMALYLDERNHFALFASPDLKSWTRLQDITLDFDDECPDFFPLNLDGDPQKQKWIFTAANGHYIVGTFDGKQFVRETDSLDSDRGPGSFYAPQTYSDAPDGRRIQIGWLRGDHYEGMPFNQQLAFPCELTLRSTPRGPRLFKWPVKEIESLYLPDRNQSIEEIRGELFDISMEFIPGSHFLIKGDVHQMILTVRGFPITYQSEGATGAIMAWDRRVSVVPKEGKVRLRILVDRTSIEIFINDGETVMSGPFLPPDVSTGISFFTSRDDTKIPELQIRTLKSAWPTIGSDREKK